MKVSMNEIEITAQLLLMKSNSILDYRHLIHTQISDISIFDFILQQENETENRSLNTILLISF